MKILIEHDISVEKWDRLLNLSPYASAFQSFQFHCLFNSIKGLSSAVYAIEDNFQIKGICVVTFQKESGIKGFFSRRAIIYGGPILNGINEEEFELLIRTIEEKTSGKVIYTEIRNLHSYNDFDRIYDKNGWRYLPYQNFIVDCSDKELLLKRMGSNRKRQIKKAVDSGVIVKEAETIEEVSVFYKMIKDLYNKKIGKPLPPFKFFEEFFNTSSGKYLLIQYQSIIIGGIMCPVLKGKCIYELYIVGLDDEYKNQYPSVMATWAALEYANANNIPIFDFMGAGKKNQDYGVREFKSKFGGELVEYGRYIKINNILLYKIGELGIRLIRTLKK